MGNCLKLREARTWVDDEDWDYVDSESMKQLKEKKEKGESGRTMTGEKPRVVSSSTKVKIKLTKKQLEELSQLLETHGLQIEQALTQFINKSNITSREHGSQIVAWRPALQCIPEE